MTRSCRSWPELRRPPSGKPNACCSPAPPATLLGAPPELKSLRSSVFRGPPEQELAAVMHARRTQTNEASARCATLLPLLAMLPGPLALIEVGASAGLTLLPDRYSYDYAGHYVQGTDPDAPVIACEPRGPVPLPDRVPEVTWRAGLDLNPLDVTSDDEMHWLECLIWPGEGGRLARLRAAIAIARRHPPRVFRGDLLTDLPALARQAPGNATLVVFHSAVLAYVDPPRRGEARGDRRGPGRGVDLQRGAARLSRCRRRDHRRRVALRQSLLRAHARRPPGLIALHRQPRGLAPLASGGVGRCCGPRASGREGGHHAAGCRSPAAAPGPGRPRPTPPPPPVAAR